MLCCYKQLEQPPGLPVLHGITASLSRYPRPVTAPCFFLGPVCVTQCRLLALAGPLGAIFSVSTCPLGVGLLLVLLGVSPGLVPAALSVLPITNGGYRTDRLPGLCTCICPLSPCLLGVGLPLVALCVALCAIPAMPGSSPTERHGGRLVRLVLLPAGFLPYRGVFLTHERATGSERKPPKVSESGGYAGLRPALVCVRPPACPSACAAVRT
jgi:hypothetical protein